MSPQPTIPCAVGEDWTPATSQVIQNDKSGHPGNWGHPSFATVPLGHTGRQADPSSGGLRGTRTFAHSPIVPMGVPGGRVPGGRAIQVQVRSGWLRVVHALELDENRAKALWAECASLRKVPGKPLSS